MPATSPALYDASPWNLPFAGTGQGFASHEDVAWKRLTATINVPATGATSFDFATAFNLEPEYDHLVVEVHTAGVDDWTTLPEAHGLSGQALASCQIGWNSVHPFVDHYQTITDPAAGVCAPTGTTGAWHSLTGNSYGWLEASYDLSGYAGKAIEVSISTISDFAVGGTGAQIDNVRVTTDGVATTLADFEAGLGSLTAAPSPDGSPPAREPWTTAGALDFPGDEAAIVRTRNTLVMGFGLEQLTTPDRNRVVGQALRYLLR